RVARVGAAVVVAGARRISTPAGSMERATAEMAVMGEKVVCRVAAGRVMQGAVAVAAAPTPTAGRRAMD
ncbi:MAG TPA: hypothetical protein DCR74_17870, partial [Achromobacter sp.]|nr:hypothetical protein [Achromobacter sp.]